MPSPEINEADGYNITLFPICSECSHSNSDRQIKTPVTIEITDKDKDKDNLEGIVDNIPKDVDKKNEPKFNEVTDKKNKGIYKHYLRRNCKHGIVGKECNWQHPKLCYDWKGSAKCRDKMKCSVYYHPKICETNKESRVCERLRCSDYHLPFQ